MKRTIAGTLLFMLLLACLPMLAGAEQMDPTKHNTEPVYTARSSANVRILAQPDADAKVLGSIPKGKRFNVYWVDPTWVEVQYDKMRGYIRRANIEAVRVIDLENTPPYGVEVYHYVAVIDGEAAVTSQPGSGDTLITLYDGANIAFIGFEDGYGKLIYKRQYAYIDSNCIRELRMVDRNLEDPAVTEPIGVYVSFYNIADTEANRGRMINLQVAGDRLSALVFKNGDKLDFNAQVGPYRKANGYQPAPVLINGETKLGYGGGTCQVSSTLYNTCLQLPGITILKRRPHGPSGASYLPHGVDAAVGNSSLNFCFRNDYPYPIRVDAHAQDGALYIAIYRAEETLN